MDDTHFETYRHLEPIMAWPLVAGIFIAALLAAAFFAWIFWPRRR